MSNFEWPSLIPQHYSPYDSRDTINELRAGGSRLTEAAWLFLTIFMLKWQCSDGWVQQPVQLRPPHYTLWGQSQPPQHMTSSSKSRTELQMVV